MVPRDMLHMVPLHWYRFPPLNPLWHSLIGIMMTLLGIISVAGNGMVLYVMMSTKSLRTPTNMLICNLAFSDFAMMVFNAPTMAINCFYETWILGPFMCEFYGMYGSLVGNVSIMSLMFISRDRYNAIVKGVSASPLTHKKAALQIIFIWVYGLVWTLLPFFGWSRYVPEGNMTSCTIDYFTKDWKHASYTLVYGTCVYFMPLSVIIYSYSKIVMAVNKHEKTLRNQARKMNVASIKANVDQKKERADIRLAKISFMTVALWFLAWTPYLIIAWYGILSEKADRLTPLASIWGSVFAKTASVYNPIVYAISHPRYRRELFRKFPSLACTVDSGDDSRSEMSATTGISDTPALRNEGEEKF